MPTYAYECRSCGHELEALQSITEPKLTKCPKCGKDDLSRLIGSGSGVIFKGSGFYETDYKKKAPVKEDKPAVSPCAQAASCPVKNKCGCAPA